MRALLGEANVDLHMFDHTHTAVEIADHNGALITVNVAWERMTGYSAAEAIGRTLAELVRSEHTPIAVYEEMEAAIQAGRSWSGTYMSRRRDGTSYPQHTTGVPVLDEQGQLRYVIVHKSDLSRVAVELAREAMAVTRDELARNRFRALMNGCKDAILISDWKSARFFEANDTACEMFGFSREELLTMKGVNLVDPSHHEEVNRVSQAVRETGAARDSQLLHRRKDGSTLWMDLMVTRFQTGTEDGVVAILRDVTDQVERARELTEALHDLRDRNMLFRVAFEDSPIGLAMSGRGGLLTKVNPAFCQMLGYTEAEMIGRTSRSMTHPDDVVAEAEKARRLFAGEYDHYTMQKRFIRRDGQIVHAAMNIARTELRGEELFVAQVIDVSHHRQAQQQIERASHLAALGRMAAAVAHDVNNPAAYLQLNIAELERRVRADELAERDRPEILQMLSDCANGIKRIGDIVRELQVFGTDVNDAPRLVDLADVIHVSCRLAAHEVRHHAKLQLELSAVPTVIGQPSKLGRVVTNLVLNAARAIGTDDPANNSVTVRCESRVNEIVVAVTDTGPGLPTDRENLFEPFVRGAASTGQGLGLWICAEIIQQHGGTISAQNVEGAGARFTIRLPAMSVPSTSTPTAPALAIQRCRVLLIDDEPVMLGAIRRGLRSHHDISMDTDAANALTRLENGEQFDVVVCDLMMPGVSGWEFYKRLTRLDSALARRVVFITGGAIGPEATSFLENHDCKVVIKPFRVDDLLGAIAEAQRAKP